jgi:hypothetical protein
MLAKWRTTKNNELAHIPSITMAKSHRRPAKSQTGRSKTRKASSRARRRSILEDMPSDELLEHLGLSADEFGAIRRFQNLSGKARVKESRKVIQDSIIEITTKPDPRFVLALRYGVRSIAHLIDLIDSTAFRKKGLKSDALGLPLSSENSLSDSSLKLHLLDKNQGFGIVNRWKEFSKDKSLVRLDHPGARRVRYWL